MANLKDLYEILGVLKSASADDIKKSYRKLAKKFHPDMNPGNSAAEQRFKEISVAHEVLGDSEKRKLYDEFGQDSLRPGFNADQARAFKQYGGPSGFGGFQDMFSQGGGRSSSAGINFDDVFETLFRRGSAQQRSKTRTGPKGQDIEHEITVDFKESISGAERTFEFSPALSASGSSAGSGSSTSADSKSIRVRIPPGVRDGTRVKVRGHGNGGMMGGPPGDLYLKVRVANHPKLRRIDDDLELDVPITIVEAYRGAKIQIPTLEGSVTLTVPPLTQSGARLRLRGRGVPTKSGERGDFYVRVLVRLPDQASDAAKAAIDALEPCYRSDVRIDLQL